MSENSDRDLSAAFEDLRAPESTANYTTRTPGLDVPSTRSRWPQAVAGVLAIALAVAGAGTFLALRSARQGGAPASSTGNPPARSGAAMAYDSAAGVTVMYGGTDGSGTTLTDTWTWDGSTWTAAAKGPGQLVDVRMVDDPADAGVLAARHACSASERKQRGQRRGVRQQWQRHSPVEARWPPPGHSKTAASTGASAIQRLPASGHAPPHAHARGDTRADLSADRGGAH